MDMTERTLRAATEHFRQADSHLQETEAQLRKLLVRLQRASNPPVARTLESYTAPRPFERPVPAGS